MPVENGAYVSPTWVNGAPPALSVSECNGFARAAESAQYQIGDILFSTRSAVEMGANWLKCDGGFVDVFQNPELAELLKSEWTTGTLPGTGNPHIAYGAGKFVCAYVESQNTKIAYSRDAVSWTVTESIN